MGFFDAPLCVRRGDIQLHNILPGHRTGIFHRHGHGDNGVQVKSGFGGITHRPIEGGVGKAIAEGEYHVVSVPILAIGQTTGFIVPIAHIDAFLVVHGIVHAQVVLVGGLVGTEILEGGVLAEIRRPSVNQPAGGIHRTIEYFAQCGDTVGAGEANPYRRVDLVRKGGIGWIGEEGSLKAGGNVEYDNHMLKARVTHGRKQITFILIQFQIMAVGADRAFRSSLVAGQIEALAADAGDHHQRGIMEGSIALFYRVCILALRRFSCGDALVAAAVQIAGIGGTGRAGLTVIFIEGFQRSIQRKARIRQAGVQILIVAGIKSAGA